MTHVVKLREQYTCLKFFAVCSETSTMSSTSQKKNPLFKFINFIYCCETSRQGYEVQIVGGKEILGRYLGLRRTKEAEMWRRETSKNVAEIPFGKAGNFAKKTYFIGVSR